MYAHECIIMPVIMYCRVSTPTSTQLRSKLGFNLYDITLPSEELVLQSATDDAFGSENMKTQYRVLGYKINIFLMTINLQQKLMKRDKKTEILGKKIVVN